ncbi:MutS-related protein [Sphingobacterium cellulitidis]|uniref:MutS-related protein n=1 Tax=Sphingobacterium cellulitidis TaxID=1768011 RepID=UPI000B93CB9A|nr:DNA mismatch repair protein MutS [Sphingobacterium cellulitidis]OYD44544.1 DNA mismatch repair protein MutS [Sphingobacterium cellulitidis]
MSAEFYQNNVGKTQGEIKSLEKQINKNAFLRLGLMIAGAIGIWQLFSFNNIFFVLLAMILLIFLFAFLVFRQAKVDRKLQEAKVFLSINENELNINNRKKNMYDDGQEFEDPKHPYTSDLDIFGPNSLFELVNRCATKDGVAVLQSWMKSPSSKDEITQRQEAVEELKSDPEHLQAFQTKMLFNLGSKINLRSYIYSYFHDKSFQFGNAFYRSYVPLVPWIFLAGILFSIFVFNIGGYLFGLALIHLLWTIALAGKVSQFSNKVDKIGVSLIGFADAIKLMEDKEYQAKLNLELQSKIQIETQQKKLSGIIHELGKLIDKLDVRNNMLVGAILNMLFLWDFKQIMAISKWKDQYEDSILSGFDAVAKYESLVSLSLLAYNHADWQQPKILNDFEKDSLLADEVNHPLIPENKSVGNDYNANDHKIALITGSNMAGKSTFLRTIGINAVLAYTGAVVCAKRFELPIYQLVTYMRIKDSLNESTSTFKAELDRMKFILDRVKDIPSSFFLIDEMLRGTNSVDKYLGSKAIIKKLIDLRGRGMLATHDLQLSELINDYPGYLKNYHFDIQVQGSEMLFDYKLKDGACTIFNASMLLKGIGIVVESEKVN